jgi:hypothetical protein
MTELSYNHHQADSYSRLGPLLPRLEMIMRILIRLFRGNYYLRRIKIPAAMLMHNNPFHRQPHLRVPDAERENQMCSQVSRFFPRASEAYDKACAEYLIDPSITSAEVNEMESFIANTEDMLSDFHPLQYRSRK